MPDRALFIEVTMIQKILARILLSPFAVLYGLGIAARDFLYEIRFFKSIAFSIPVISVGNLSVGGTGKTPHVEYLIKELLPYIKVGVLSRGYSRKSKGFYFVHPRNNAEQVGDEPLQIKRKYPGAIVAVVENRALGIPQVLKSVPDLQLIVLDDAFQHRPIRPGLNVLLTDYNNLYTRDFLLPAGRLREFRSAYKRADIIVVSKTSPQMTQDEKNKLIEEINPRPHQKLFFSYFTYFHPYHLWNPQHAIVLNDTLEVLMVSAIANTEYLLDYLDTRVKEVKSIEFEDHHYFTKFEIGNMKRQFEQMEGKNKIVLTTEKDATRLALHREYLIQERLPIFVLPIKISFHPDHNQSSFIDSVKKFLLDFKV